MDLGLSGRRALVLGGSSGIGRATAALLVAEGARVCIAARDAARLAEAAAETGAEPLVCDARDPASVAALAARFDRCDVLVSAFGGSHRSAFEALSDDDWLANYELNLLGTVRVLRAFADLLAASSPSRVVLLGAASGRQPTEHQAVSNVHKAGLHALTKTLANEWAPRGVSVNCVAPGRAFTPLWQNRARAMSAAEGISEEAVLARAASDIPTRRFASAEEVARLVVFLASQAAAYVTGQTVLADGGLVRGV
jgi:3-oxoacyl-[acyl-carrier protein] reductase